MEQCEVCGTPLIAGDGKRCYYGCDSPQPSPTRVRPSGVVSSEARARAMLAWAEAALEQPGVPLLPEQIVDVVLASQTGVTAAVKVPTRPENYCSRCESYGPVTDQLCDACLNDETGKVEATYEAGGVPRPCPAYNDAGHQYGPWEEGVSRRWRRCACGAAEGRTRDQAQ